MDITTRQGTDSCGCVHRGFPPLAVSSAGTASPSGSAGQSAAAAAPQARVAISWIGLDGSWCRCLSNHFTRAKGCVYFATTPSTLVFYSFIEPCVVSRFFLQKPVSGGHEPEAS